MSVRPLRRAVHHLNRLGSYKPRFRRHLRRRRRPSNPEIGQLSTIRILLPSSFQNPTSLLLNLAQNPRI